MNGRSFRVINVMAASIDGYVALHSEQSDAERHAQGFSNHEDWDHLLQLIQTADVIVLGSSTLQAGGGVIDQARTDGTHPVWVTLSRKGIPPEHVFWKQDYATRVIISPEPLSLPPHTGLVLNLHGDDPLQILSGFLEEKGLQRILLFGGGHINKLFYQAARVDELILTVCPVMVARTGAVPLVATGADTAITHFRLLSARPQGNLVFLHYEVLPASSTQTQ